MNNSEHFELNLVEGSDIVNPLTQDVPNYSIIDEQMYKNQNAGVQLATELKSGTTHAITRLVPDAPMFRFNATSNWTAGDVMTVDGIQVSALTPKGETLQTGAYVINSSVICCLNGSVVTVYVSGAETADNANKLGGQLPEYYATAEQLNGVNELATSAGTLATQATDKINEINIALNKIDLDSVQGGVRFECVIPSGSTYADFVVEFPKPFDSSKSYPHVIASVEYGSTSQSAIPVLVTTGLSYTGFKVRLFRQVGAPTNNNPSPGFRWLAFQLKN